MNQINTDIQEETVQPGVLDRPLVDFLPVFTIRSLIILAILALAVVSRFYNIDLRVMSHDEVNHVVPSYDLFTGKGYRHDPVTHGPFQFHIVATSYFLLGDSDFSSRLPAALFSIAAIAFILFYFPRYLGKNGALIAAFLFVISPFMLFYGRYTRNEGFIELFGVMMLFATLAYLETGRKPYLYLLTASIVLHFCTKETAFIYTAQLLIFLALNFLRETAELKSLNTDARRRFTVFVLAAVAFMIIALGAGAWNAELNKPAAEGAAAAATPAAAASGMQVYVQYALYGGLSAAILLGIAALVNLVRALGWEKIRHLRSFDLIVLIMTLILPQLAAFPVKIIGSWVPGWDPLDYTSNGLLHTGIFILLFLAISIAIGYWWKGTVWLKNAALFYVVFIVFYTTFFTNGRGFFTGMVGGLGYWLSQQGVERGSQPWYFYGLIQVPVYEYLAALGTLLALYFGIRYNRLVAWAS
ncbi:MAG: flippase activity-associated protein Agl23, partial [Leptolinea sp.]